MDVAALPRSAAQAGNLSSGAPMRTTLTTRLATAALVGLAGFSLPAAARAGRPPDPTVVLPAEPHPDINSAIAALERPKSHLTPAAHNFCGQRGGALAARV